jgi:hypothetical protein
MKTIKLIIAAIMLMTIASEVKAQDKYEYGTVVYAAYSVSKGYIYVSEENKYEKTDVKIEEGAIAENLTPVLSVINKMSKDGWEVYNTNTLGAAGMGVHIYYFLRKKKS